MRLADKLEAWVARAQLVALGAEPLRAQAQSELARGRPWTARYLALRILQEAGETPLVLAVWADAAEAMFLDHETAEALSRLATLLPYRADVWVRLAQAQQRLGQESLAAWERGFGVEEPADAVQQAAQRLLELALDDQDQGRIAKLFATLKAEPNLPATLRLRLAEAAMALGEPGQAVRLLESTATPDVLDARGWFTLVCANSDLVHPTLALGRALMLGPVELQRRVALLLIEQYRPALLGKLLPLVRQLGLEAQPEWQAARALFERRPGELANLFESHPALRQSPRMRLSWLEASLAARDASALARAVESLESSQPQEAQQNRLFDAQALLRALHAPAVERLLVLDRVCGPGRSWASEIAEEVYASWLGQLNESGWRHVIDEVETLAKAALDIEALNRAAALRVDLDLPLRVAVIGEFNAGKSSLINAVLGQPVAPVGVLPTTATVNRLRWAPDRFVRVEFHASEQPSRVLEYAALREFLAGTDPVAISSVSIFSPIEALRQLEIIDTPGFNAGGGAHADVAFAAARAAHVLIWVLDATAPLKASDVENLKRLRQVQTPTCVVVNKSDRLSQAELQEVMHHIATGLANNQIESLLPPLPFSAALAVAGLGLDERAGEAAGLDGLKNLLARLLSRSGELRGRVLMQRTLEVVSRLQAGAALTRPQVALERQRAVARTIRRLRAQRAALVAEWALRLRCVLPQLSSELARLLRNDDSADRYVADRVSSVVGDELFLLVSAALPPPMLATLSEPELRSRLNALARGTSLGMHGLTRRTESDLAARVAALAHQEVLLVFQEALAAGGARNEPERKADGTDFACPTGASALWRLMPLARALKAESWNQTRTRSDNVVRKVSKAEH